MPVYVRNFSCGTEHGLIDIDSGDLAGCIADPIDSSRDQARAARNVEDPISVLAASLPYQVIRPRFLHGVAIARVKCRRIATDLESAYDCPPLACCDIAREPRRPAAAPSLMS